MLLLDGLSVSKHIRLSLVLTPFILLHCCKGGVSELLGVHALGSMLNGCLFLSLVFCLFTFIVFKKAGLVCVLVYLPFVRQWFTLLFRIVSSVYCICARVVSGLVPQEEWFGLLPMCLPVVSGLLALGDGRF